MRAVFLSKVFLGIFEDFLTLFLVHLVKALACVLEWIEFSHVRVLEERWERRWVGVGEILKRSYVPVEFSNRVGWVWPVY